MITVNDYSATRLEVCADCAAGSDRAVSNQFWGLDVDPDTGEILEPHFGAMPCDWCYTRLWGHRYGATLLTRTTTTN